MIKKLGKSIILCLLISIPLANSEITKNSGFSPEDISFINKFIEQSLMTKSNKNQNWNYLVKIYKGSKLKNVEAIDWSKELEVNLPDTKKASITALGYKDISSIEIKIFNEPGQLLLSNFIDNNFKIKTKICRTDVSDKAKIYLFTFLNNETLSAHYLSQDGDNFEAIYIAKANPSYNFEIIFKDYPNEWTKNCSN
jgi:hypothetical protein